MPDITMCSGEGCPMRVDCYRFTATPSTRQAYFAEPPVEVNGSSAACEHFDGDHFYPRPPTRKDFEDLKKLIDNWGRNSK